MTKTYPNTRSSNSIEKSAFNIVYIANSEANIMSGSNKDHNGSGESGVDREGKEYECVGRIAKIPLVESTALAVSNLYTSVKQSHCVVQSMFENVEEGWLKGTEVVSPVTSKIEETLEGPLRIIDNAACVSLDFIEENIPSVKLPPQEIYEKSKDCLNHQIFTPVVNFTSSIIGNFKDIISQYAESIERSDNKQKCDNNDCGKNADSDKNNK